jgi:APA family basic amino acid/polyamine antiporter
MSRDGLLPPFVSRVHPRFKTPWVITIVTGVVVAIFGGVLPVGDAGDLCNIGTLLAFVIVSIGVLVLRVREPNLPRRFTTPWVWIVAPLGALSSLGLMVFLPLETWIRLVAWFVIGMFVYFSYGVRHSKLAESPSIGAASQTQTN